MYYKGLAIAEWGKIYIDVFWERSPGVLSVEWMGNGRHRVRLKKRPPLMKFNSEDTVSYNKYPIKATSAALGGFVFLFEAKYVYNPAESVDWLDIYVRPAPPIDVSVYFPVEFSVFLPSNSNWFNS